METFIGALLYIGLTIGAYFYDYKGASRKNKILSSILFLAMLLSLVSWQSLLLIKRGQNQQMLQVMNANLQNKLDEQEEKNQELQDQIRLEPVKKVDEPSQSSLSPSPQNTSLDNLNIQYFDRESDPKKLAEKLKELNVNIDLEELSLLNCELQSCPYQSNAIWYGSDVEIEQVKAIAKLLISSGINIKVIQRFFEPEQKPSNLIQIGAENRALTCKTWQKEEILNAESFPENRLGCP